MGITLSETIREHNKAKPITNASWLNIMPEIPRTKRRGRNITMVVNVLAMIAGVTSLLPLIADSLASIPDCR